MTTVRYTTIKGEVIAEKRNGVRRLYVPDPLGSTVALLDNTQTQVDTFTYWPYGEVRTSTGTTSPPFQFVGTKGYYTGSANKTYVRARYLDVVKGRWLTQDPASFDSGDWRLYRYSGNRPTVLTDAAGLLPVGGGDLVSSTSIDAVLNFGAQQYSTRIAPTQWRTINLPFKQEGVQMTSASPFLSLGVPTCSPNFTAAAVPADYVPPWGSRDCSKIHPRWQCRACCRENRDRAIKWCDFLYPAVDLNRLKCYAQATNNLGKCYATCDTKIPPALQTDPNIA